MPALLEAISRVLPLTYALDAMQLAAGGTWTDVRVAVVSGFIVGALVARANLRRRTP